MTDKAASDLWWKDAVIYCADVATWLDCDGDGNGDLAGLTRRLDYLSGLGISTLWMMPFYPSPLGDDGYDVTDYYAVDPRFGTLGDFVEMIRTAGNLGIRVLVDLVMNHTSDQHPWFQQARRDRRSRYRSYYVWSDEKQAEPSEVVFPGEQDSTWTYGELAGQVEFIGRRRGDAIFLGEANVSPQEQERYFAIDDGDGVQMLFDFRTCAAQWLAHARGRAEPLIDSLNQRPRIPEHAQFANFARHHDELNLGMLSEAERGEVFEAFAPEPGHRVYGRGIRRRLAPMLGNDRRRIELALALTLALPGTPVLLYGDEIGMGEDLSLPGRLAVRGPMQWSSRHAGGFSAAATPYRPARAGGPYGYAAVNVAGQRHDPGSLYTWVARAISVRRQCPELGWGEWRTLKVSDPRVLAIETRWRDGCVVTLHNLSAEPARVRLPDDVTARPHQGDIRQLLGDTTTSPRADGTGTAARAGVDLELAGYGFRWLRLTDDTALG